MLDTSAYLTQQAFVRSNTPTQKALSLNGLFQAALRRGQMSRLLGWITGSTRLEDLARLIRSRPVRSQHYAGVQTVSMKDIRGTEGRVRDFDRWFNPLHARSRSRWMSVASARLRRVSLPPVELIRIGNRYFVRDGHHRLSVARSLGEDFIEAEVTIWVLG